MLNTCLTNVLIENETFFRNKGLVGLLDHKPKEFQIDW